MPQISFQPYLRPALLEVSGCKDFREERDLFIRIDQILTCSGIEYEFIELSIQERHLNFEKMSQAQQNYFYRGCTMALRGNIARLIKNLSHREFCKLLPDSTILRWFLGIERLDGIKSYAKSTSDRFCHWLSGDSLQHINARLITLLSQAADDENFNLETPPDFEQVYFDSTCLKADIHFPVDWVLLRDLTRTLMKATVIIRREGLRNRMPQEPLDFLSDMNSLVMKMTATNRVKGGKQKRKNVLREMKALGKRVAIHAKKHIELLERRGQEISLSPGRIKELKERLEGVLKQVSPAINQAHERLIGERIVDNKDKILSLYDSEVEVLVRGKSNAQVEFGNKLWLGESEQGFIVDYLLERNQTSDAKHVLPAIERLRKIQDLPVKKVWGDRGLSSASNTKALKKQDIYDGLCPKNVQELQIRLKEEPSMRFGLKRRAGTEARISILLKNFMGDKPRSKGFKHRQMMTGWAVFTHNLWVLARLPQKKAEAQAA